MMRTSPTQYFENQPLQFENSQPNYTLYFIIISIIAGVALGLGIAAIAKK